MVSARKHRSQNGIVDRPLDRRARRRAGLGGVRSCLQDAYIRALVSVMEPCGPVPDAGKF